MVSIPKIRAKCYTRKIMITVKEVEKLVELSRLEIPQAEVEALTKEIGSILGYIDQIQKAPIKDMKTEKQPVRNVVRGDDKPNVSGACTKEILAEAPKSREGFVEVKKILNNN